jgi:hypothetical protein
MNPAQLFSSLEAKYRLPEGYLSRVYQLESSSGKKLYNEQSGATGPFQFMPGTARGMGLQDPNDLAQSADAAARLAVQNRAYLQQNGIENVDGRVLYLAHVQGAGGAQRLLENADKPATAVVGKEPVVQNAGRPDQKAGEFAGFLMDRYQPTQGEAYSALGTSAPVGEAAAAAPTQEASRADSRDERRQTLALNTLLGLSKELQQENRPAMLPIPRLSYAKGGIVSLVEPTDAPPPRPAAAINVPETTQKVVDEIGRIAKKGDLDEFKIAFLLRMAATNTIPEERAAEFADEIVRKDVPALLRRFKRYPRALRMIARLNLALGGLAGQGYGPIANQHPRSKPQPTKRMGHDTKAAKSFAKGGEVGGHNEAAQYDLSQYATNLYGPEIGSNMIRRSEGDPNKLLFALNQYAKNVVGVRSPAYAKNSSILQAIAKKHRLKPVETFNRTEDALATEQELDRLIRDVPKKDRVFREALLRMKAMVGWKPKPVRSQNGRRP